jgi:hypothetical protein
MFLASDREDLRENFFFVTGMDIESYFSTENSPLPSLAVARFLACLIV